MKNVFSYTIVLFLILVGCSPKFEIKELKDKFTSSDEPIMTVGTNNRISSKSTLGGTHIDLKGVYFNPFVSKKNNQIVESGFYIKHLNFEYDDGFNPILSIKFLINGETHIDLKFKHLDSDYDIGSYNTVTKEMNTTFEEQGISYIDIDDLKKICLAKTIDIKIIGKNHTQTYDDSEIHDSFKENMRQFYNEVINK